MRKIPYDIVSRDDLERKINEGVELTLIEVLPEEAYREAHLPGAINIPGDRLRRSIAMMAPDREGEVIVYCAKPSCTASDRAARLLSELGYSHVGHYRGGKEHWREGGLPLESGTPVHQ
jgi:rhodanese-related sulfurtransferase